MLSQQQMPVMVTLLRDRQTITTAVSEFYRRVLVDPDLSPYFADHDLTLQRRQLTNFGGYVLDETHDYQDYVQRCPLTGLTNGGFTETSAAQEQVERRRLTIFLGYALGWPEAYQGRTLRQALLRAFAGLGLNAEQFIVAVCQLLEVLEAAGIAPDTLSALLGTIATIEVESIDR